MYSYCSSFDNIQRCFVHYSINIEDNSSNLCCGIFPQRVEGVSLFSGTCFFSERKLCKGGGVTSLIRNCFCVLPHGVIPDIAAIAVKLKCRRKWGVNQQIVVQTSADPANWFNQALSGLTLESEGCFHFKPCTLFNWPSCQVQLKIQFIRSFLFSDWWSEH